MSDTPMVGFVGLGAMGGPMAAHLARAGQLTAVWNRTPETAHRWLQQLEPELPRPHLASDAADLAGRCQMVVVCVSRDEDVESVVTAMATALPRGALVVDCSTISPMTARAMAERLETHGVGFVDAPVSGGVEGARQGNLAVMAGGSAADFARAETVLTHFARAVYHMGPVGNGQATKAVNQVMVAGIAEAVCEALALGEKLNLPQERLLQVTGSGAAASWFLHHRGQSMLADRFKQGFKQALLLKDLDIILDLARELNSQLQTVTAARADYADLVVAGDGDNDISGLIKLKRRQLTAS